jgi:hypothetical protein
MGVFNRDELILVTVNDEQARALEVSYPPAGLHVLKTGHPLVHIGRKTWIANNAAFFEIRDDFVGVLVKDPEVGRSPDHREAINA